MVFLFLLGEMLLAPASIYVDYDLNRSCPSLLILSDICIGFGEFTAELSLNA